MIKEINRLKKELNAIILAHNYQPPEVQDIADFVGDSLDLAKKGARTEASIIVFCGVRFMAESAKILAPEKTVLLPVQDAGCAMADMVDEDKLKDLKQKNPDAKVVCYVNTTARTKALCDYCCTSANALAVVQSIPEKKIIFVPDRNLGHWVKTQTDKEIILYPGYCYVHKKIKRDTVSKIKSAYPDAEVLIHPEADPETLELADYVLSTNGMVNQVKKSRARRFIIGTESGLIHRLKKENPGKEFFSAGDALVCVNMKKTRLFDILHALENMEYKIEIEPAIMNQAKRALQKMVEIQRGA